MWLRELPNFMVSGGINPYDEGLGTNAAITKP